MRHVFDLGRILPPLCRPAPPPLLPDLFPDASAWGATAARPPSGRANADGQVPSGVAPERRQCQAFLRR